MVILALGILCVVFGLIFLVGCFTRVDSPAFIERASGNEAKITKLRSLQDAWDKLGKPRQFVASTSGYLIMGVGLLLLRYDPHFSDYLWVVPALLAVNFITLLNVKKYANSVLDPQLSGHAEALQVIKRQIRTCVIFGIVFAILAYGPNNSFKPTPLRGAA
jgi:hypothetical protein